jgi:hypothetical protein
MTHDKRPTETSNAEATHARLTGLLQRQTELEHLLRALLTESSH